MDNTMSGVLRSESGSLGKYHSLEYLVFWHRLEHTGEYPPTLLLNPG